MFDNPLATSNDRVTASLLLFFRAALRSRHLGDELRRTLSFEEGTFVRFFALRYEATKSVPLLILGFARQLGLVKEFQHKNETHYRLTRSFLERVYGGKTRLNLFADKIDDELGQGQGVTGGLDDDEADAEDEPAIVPNKAPRGRHAARA
ncbi:hypothetical protein [Neoaquamicrobium sediminum]|uniref:hypothetical protein n=1 Tax=Neoaquamicrobium sediminum TaxID=1849104 RepID=UPI00403624B5